MSQSQRPDRERGGTAAGWYRLNRSQQHYWDGTDWTGDQRHTPRAERDRRPRPRPWVEILAVVLALAVLAALAYVVIVVV